MPFGVKSACEVDSRAQAEFEVLEYPISEVWCQVRWALRFLLCYFLLPGPMGVASRRVIVLEQPDRCCERGIAMARGEWLTWVLPSGNTDLLGLPETGPAGGWAERHGQGKSYDDLDLVC